MVTQAEIIDLFGVKFRRFIYDNFSSVDSLHEVVSQTAIIVPRITEIELSTGIQEASEAKIYYNFPAFNPWYSTTIFKLQFTSIDDILAFIGFKATTANPTWAMTESHAGFIIYEGNLYATSADGDNQQTILIKGFDPCNNLLYRIIKNKFSLRPLPIIYPYFDGLRIEKPKREWSPENITGTYPPENQDHYFVAYIKNNVGLTKAFRIKHFVYGEEYAD